MIGFSHLIYKNWIQNVVFFGLAASCIMKGPHLYLESRPVTLIEFEISNAMQCNVMCIV